MITAIEPTLHNVPLKVKRLRTHSHDRERPRALGSCSLRLWAFDELGFYGEQRLSLSSPYAAHLPWRQALTQALGTLPNDSEKDDGAGGLGLVGGISEERVVAHPEVLEWSVRTARDWEPIEDSADRTSLRLDDGKKALRRCFGRQRVWRSRYPA